MKQYDRNTQMIDAACCISPKTKRKRTTMKIPKWMVFAIGLAVIGGAISHFYDDGRPQNPYTEKLLQNIPSNEQLLVMNESIKAGNTNELQAVLKNLNAPPETEVFGRAVNGGSISEIFGIQRQRGYETLALRYDIKYNKKYSVQERDSALLVMRLDGSQWVLDNVFPGAILVPTLPGSTGKSL